MNTHARYIFTLCKKSRGNKNKINRIKLTTAIDKAIFLLWCLTIASTTSFVRFQSKMFYLLRPTPLGFLRVERLLNRVLPSYADLESVGLRAGRLFLRFLFHLATIISRLDILDV